MSTVLDRGGAAGSKNQAPVIKERPKRRAPWVLDFYRSSVGKKWVMAVTGLIMIGYVVAHMVGNLKMYFGAEDLDEYAEFLRRIAYPILPETAFLWIMRPILLLAVLLHIHSAYSLTVLNRKARPVRYQSHRDYVAANFASRTMRWTGVIVLLFIVFHLFDLTWGQANPEFVYGNVYDNVVASFERVPVAIFYVIANLALGLHLYHGAWSMFQSLGINSPRINIARRWIAVAIAAVVTIGNVSFPIAVQLGIVG